jgi:ABC-type transporter Mla subunit MlaD
MANSTGEVLAAASAHAACLADALTEALEGSDRDTHAPGAVVDVIDGTLRQLHQIRERAVGESRRRFDAAMERSAALLDELRTRRGPVR